MSNINIIVATDKNGYFGYKGYHELPWKSYADLRRFKELTQNGILIVGYNTLRTLPTKLENRQLIVPTEKVSSMKRYLRTRRPNLDAQAIDVNELHQRLANHDFDKPVWLIGGNYVYNRYRQYADHAYISINQKRDVWNFNDRTRIRFPIEIYMQDTLKDGWHPTEYRILDEQFIQYHYERV